MIYYCSNNRFGWLLILITWRRGTASINLCLERLRKGGFDELFTWGSENVKFEICEHTVNMSNMKIVIFRLVKYIYHRYQYCNTVILWKQ